MKWLELAFTLFLLGVACAVGIVSFRLGIGNIHTPGSGFLPFTAAGAMVVLVVWQLFVVARSADAGPVFKDRDSVLRLLYTVLISGLMAASLETLGFFLTMGLFLPFLMRVIGKEPWGTTIVVSLITLVAAFVLFVYLLNVNLPRGLF